jgi:hypothetical protein
VGLQGHVRAARQRSAGSRVSLGTRKSFLVLFFKKEQKKENFFLKKEAKTFLCWARVRRPARALGVSTQAAAGRAAG